MTKTTTTTATVVLGATYLSPAGVTCKPVSVGADLVVEFTGGNFAFRRVVRRTDFAAYTRQF